MAVKSIELCFTMKPQVVDSHIVDKSMTLIEEKTNFIWHAFISIENKKSAVAIPTPWVPTVLLDPLGFSNFQGYWTKVLV